MPLAAGEQFASKWEFRELIEDELIDYARIDLCIVGGITEARKIAGWCETHYIKLATHNPLGPVSSAACLQLNLATSNFGVQEQPRRPGTTLTDVSRSRWRGQDGYLLPPTLPGLGIEFDREAARRAPFQMTENPHLRRLDGRLRTGSHARPTPADHGWRWAHRHRPATVAARAFPDSPGGHPRCAASILNGDDYLKLDVVSLAAAEQGAAGADAVLHLAGNPSTAATWEQVRAANIEGTNSVFEAARRQGARTRRLCVDESRHGLLSGGGPVANRHGRADSTGQSVRGQ